MKKTITVKEKQIKTTPNLVNYDKAYRTLDPQKNNDQELTFFDKHHLNAAHNAVTRHAQGDFKNKIALYHLDPELKLTKFTFQELNQHANKFANVLKKLGIKKGDRVFFFLPRTPAIYYGFLGTLKTGAIAGTLFSAFAEQALLDRLQNSQAEIVITNKNLLPRLKKVKSSLPHLKHIILEEELGKLMEKASDEFEDVKTKANDPAFMLYTSGTTGKPKGVVHAHRAILHEHFTAKWVLDIKKSDVYWCTADPGWVTGIAYEILGSLSNGASTIVYQGRFSPKTWYQIIEDFKVNIWYTAPTAIRLLQAAGDKLVKFHNLSSLRHLVSVGEPLNPEAITWSQKVIGLPFHDTWWQTETGGILIANFPALDIKLGSMGKPVPGVRAGIVDNKGKELSVLTEGNLAIKPGWSSQMLKIWRRPKKYQSYFKKGWYISGDRAYRDKDGYFWFVGRDDDVIKTAGERVGPFEVESALISHPAVIEAGVIGKPDPIRGQIIKAFVTLKDKVKPSKKLVEELKKYVKTHLAGHAYPKEIEFTDKLPKTRSGKIVRRLLRAKELGLPLGDTSSLTDV